MATQQPKVSIGIPTYNRAHTLRRAVESVLAQDYQDLELLISDNASTDDTQRLCDEFSRRDARVRYLRQPVNQGPTANFVGLLHAARSEFFMWLADDDWLDPAYVSECLSFLVAHPDYALACGSAKYYEGDRFLFRDRIINLPQAAARERVLDYYRQVNMNGEHYSLMRRAALLDIPYRHELAGDWLFVASVVFKGKLKTLESVSINRACEGMSQDVARLAAYFGHTGTRARRPYHTIAAIVCKDIAWQSPIYRPLGKIRRVLLALKTTEAIGLKLFLPSWGIRTRIRRALRSV
ncbi:MAG TPA: glycosyltransferase family 2 protein [Pyrinomonadaceae bacterium]